MTPVRMGALRGGSAGRPPTSPAPAARPEPGPAWLTALLAEAAKAAAGPAAAESAKAADPEANPSTGLPGARPERRRWELPDAGAASSICANAGRSMGGSGAALGSGCGASTGQALMESSHDVGLQGESETGECGGLGAAGGGFGCVRDGGGARAVCLRQLCLPRVRTHICAIVSASGLLLLRYSLH